MKIGNLYSSKVRRFLFKIKDDKAEFLGVAINNGDLFLLLEVCGNPLDFIDSLRCKILTANGIVGYVDLYPEYTEEVTQ